MRRVLAWLTPALLLLAVAPPSAGQGLTPWNRKPEHVGDVTVTAYNGHDDDLLTAGLGWKGLQGALPKPKDIEKPTPAELRRLAIYFNYRALVDISTEGGFGRIYGPNVPADQPAAGPDGGAGKIAGVEYLASIVDATGRPSATLLVQIPASFDRLRPCVLTAASPGSRGIYGAIAAVGEWGLKHGCAVVYTDKGTGNGIHELTTNRVVTVNGLAADAAVAGNASLFTSELDEQERQDFVRTHPCSYAVKHAHSRQNPERDWGADTLKAVEFALYAINERFAPRMPGFPHPVRWYVPANTLVIACSISNGGGAGLAAAEQDTQGLIDAVVVGEPQINLQTPHGLRVKRGSQEIREPGRHPVYGYLALANLLQPCAGFASSVTDAPMIDTLRLFQPSAEKRGGELVRDHILSAPDFRQQADEALKLLSEEGWEPGSNALHASHFVLGVSTGVTVTFANAYSRASVKDDLCGFSFASTQATSPGPCEIKPSLMPLVFGVGNGIPPLTIPAIAPDPGGSIGLMYRVGDKNVQHLIAEGDFAYTGAKRLYDLWQGSDAAASALHQGLDEVRLTGRLHGKPALIVHGRNDALVLVNHTSRPYLGMSKLADGATSQLSYIEVENGQHFDGFLGIKGYDERFLPLHYYYQQALDLMWKHARSGAPLPPSQVVRTVPRGKPAVPVEVAKNLRPISLVPSKCNLITFDRLTRTVHVPE
jgi:hydroxybutyrate-dimer hydrolase